MRYIIGRVSVLLAVLTLAPAAAAPLYQITHSIPLGAPDRWDYVVADPATHRVFVAHGDRVTVVDGGSGKILGAVGTFPGGTHGIGIATASGRGYTDDGKAGKAEVFDLATLRPLGAIDAQADADGITYDAQTRRVFVVDGDSGEITVIDAAANRAIATINVGGGLEFAESDGAGKLFVNGSQRGELVRIDIATNQVDGRWPLPGCAKPSGLAVDGAHHRVFSSCRNGVMDVMNGTTGQLVASLPIGAGTDAAKFDPVRQRAFSSNGRDGTITVIHEDTPDHFVVEGTVKTQVSGRTMAVDSSTGRIYVAAADAAGVQVPGKRPSTVPGSLKLLFLDPVPLKHLAP